jgi:hypothetical protein
VEWVFTTRGANLVRIERLDKAANRRTEVTAEEYAAYAATYYAVYFAGVRDYAQAQAFSDTAAIQAFHQGVIQYLGAVGQT